MKNLIVVALMASAASLAAWALPPQPATTVNYCPAGGIIRESLDIHTNLSHYTYTSGPNCTVAAARLLNISGSPLQYSEPNNTAPVTVELTQSRVEEGGAVNLQAPKYGFVDLMVPWVVRVTNNAFAKNAVLHFHGCLPANSVVTISGNTFAGEDKRNFNVAFDGVAAISFGVVDPSFLDPLHFGTNSQVTIADNVIENVVGAMGVDTSGIRFVPATYFLADRSKLVVRNNTVSATGVTTNPCIPFNLKGYINVIPEYDGNRDVTFEFADNTATVNNGIAWWMPGMWGPRGATDLKVNILRNRGTVNGIVNTEKFAAIHSTVNCSARGQLTFEGNDVQASGGEGILIFYEQVSQDHSVRFVDNRFRVSGGNTKVTMQPFWGLKNLAFSGNTFISDDHETNLQFTSINGTNIDGVIAGNSLDGTSTFIGIPDVLMTGGKVMFDRTEMTSRYGPAMVNVQRTHLRGGAQLQLREWSVTTTHAATISFPNELTLDGSQLHVRDSNFTSSNGNCILNFPAATLTGASVLDATGNRLTAAGGSPHMRIAGDLKASGESDVFFSFNTLYRSDKVASMTMPFVYLGGDVALEDRAQLGMWNNTFDARNNTNFVGMVTAAGNVTAGEDTLVHICQNKYFVVTNQTLMMMVVSPGLSERVNCAKYATTLPPPTTTAASGAASDTGSEPSGPSGDVNATTTLFPRVSTTTAVKNNAPATAAVGVALGAVAAVLAALLH